MRTTLLCMLTSGCLLMAVFLSGCSSLTDGASRAFSESRRTFKPKSGDYGDGTEDLDEDWSFVGEQGRGDLPKEKEPDRIWWNYFMSEKARSIERNVGIY